MLLHTPPPRVSTARRTRIARWPSAALFLMLALILAAIPPSVLGATTAMVPACSSVNLRTGTSTGTTVKTRLTTGSTVTVVTKVSGSRWRATCPTAKSGSGWYRISAINGKSVKSLYGVTYLYGATGVLKAAPAPAPAPSATKLTDSTTFYGRGYGHGVGLSQYGARGRALAGQTADEILAHYYPGTSSGSLAPDAQIRVRLLDDFAGTPSAPLTVIGRGGHWGLLGEDAAYPADARVRLISNSGTSGWRLVITDATGSILRDSAAPVDFRLEPRDPGTTLQLLSKPSSYDLFRGNLRVLLAASTADVVNELPLESYLRGVVPAEMPSGWPAKALTAQAIAARSYAAYRLRPGVSTFDAYDDTRSQVYLGVRRETTSTDAIIAATADRILRSGTKVANTLFHSTGGGATENNENVFVSSTGAKVAGPVSYLRGSSDRDPSGVAYDAAAPYATWKTKAYSLAALSTILASDSRTNVGSLTALDLHDRGVSQRLISVTLVGSLGIRTVSGDVFVAAFNAGRPASDPPLRSTLLDLAPIP
ncbi:MAG: SpoIID/LytB domain-containing protein [Chloroflexi bacterium]|nr:SpoIID/LytB domain-containing protein [Chloroflexota bacterium]